MLQQLLVMRIGPDRHWHSWLNRSAFVLQGLAMQRLLLAMAERDGTEACDFEFVMVAGHFLARDENVFTFFEGHQVKPPEHSGKPVGLFLPKPLLKLRRVQFLCQDVVGGDHVVSGPCRIFFSLQVDTCIITRCTTDRAKRPCPYCLRPWKVPKLRRPVSCRAYRRARHQHRAVGDRRGILQDTAVRCWPIRTTGHT